MPTFNGGAGADTYTGGNSNDVIYGNGGDDVLNGGGGDDTIDGGTGDDFLDGGDGFDTASFAKSTSAVTVDLFNHTASGQGSDTLFNFEAVVGSKYGDTLIGDGPHDALAGGSGNDVLIGGSGDSTLDGGAGSDTASYAGAVAGVRVDLSHAGAQDTVAAGWDTLTSIENVTGSDFDDRIFGTGAANTLDGGMGDDILDGGAGNDVLTGGAGFDIALYNDATSAVTVSLAKTGAQNTGGAGTDTLSGVEQVTGSSFDDTLTGSAGADTLDGFEGDDILQGGLGDDTLIGGAGIDTASYAAAPAGVTVDLSNPMPKDTVGAGTDTLLDIENVTGSSYADTLTGDSTANTLLGGGGADVLTGGEGADRFVYMAVAESRGVAVDRITDFGTDDVLDLSGIDANTTVAGNQAFVHTDAFHKVAGELIVGYDAATQVSTLSADVNGDAKADFTVRFNGDVTANGNIVL